MTLFGYLLLGAFVGAAIALLFYEVGRAHGQAEVDPRLSGAREAMATIQIEWVNEVPVAVCVDGNAADVVAWLEAAKEGPVLHV